MKKIVVFILAIAMCFLTACDGMTDRNIKKTVEEFILCVEEDRFRDAAELIHSDCNTTADEISSYFALLEKESALEFSGDFQLIEYEYEDYDEENPIVEGEYVKATGIVESDGVTISFEIKLVENENDFGIYRIKFRKKD